MSKRNAQKALRVMGNVPPRGEVAAKAEKRAQLQKRIDSSRALLAKFNSSYDMAKGGLKWVFGWQIALHMIHPWIFLNQGNTVTVYVILEVVVFFRIYMALEVVYVHSDVFRNRLMIVGKRPELEPATRMNSTLKLIFYDQPVMFCIVALLGTMIPLGFIIWVTERSTQPEIYKGFGRLENSYWFIFATATTVGYGDIVTKTVLGRLAAVLTGIIGISITTLVGGIVTNLMSRSREERLASQYMSAHEGNVEIRDNAARLIQALWRFARVRGNDVVMQRTRLSTLHKSNVIARIIKRFRNSRWKRTQCEVTMNDDIIGSKVELLHGVIGKAGQHLRQQQSECAALRLSIDRSLSLIAAIRSQTS